MKLKIAALAVFLLVPTQASAETCEALILQVDKAIEETQASQETKDEAQRLRDEGEVQRKTAGQCETPLMQALELLGK